jgi:hypothetical protein
MGWLSSFNWETKQDMVDHIVSNFKLVDHSVRGKVLFGLYPADLRGDNEFGIVICLIENFSPRGRPAEWGYKDMGESDYPYCFDCPERILKASTLPDTSGWRQACRDFATTRRQAFKPKHDLIIEWQRSELPDWCKGERLFRVTHVPRQPRGYWLYTSVNKPTIAYRISKRLLTSLNPYIRVGV